MMTNGTGLRANSRAARERVDLLISDGGQGCHHHVESIQPLPTKDEVEPCCPGQHHASEGDANESEVTKSLHEGERLVAQASAFPDAGPRMPAPNPGQRLTTIKQKGPPRCAEGQVNRGGKSSQSAITFGALGSAVTSA